MRHDQFGLLADLVGIPFVWGKGEVVAVLGSRMLRPLDGQERSGAAFGRKTGVDSPAEGCLYWVHVQEGQTRGGGRICYGTGERRRSLQGVVCRVCSQNDAFDLSIMDAGKIRLYEYQIRTCKCT